MLPYRVLPVVGSNQGVTRHDLYVLCPGALHQCVREGHRGVDNAGAVEAWLAQLTCRPLQRHQGGGSRQTQLPYQAQRCKDLNVAQCHAAQHVQHPESGNGSSWCSNAVHGRQAGRHATVLTDICRLGCLHEAVVRLE